VTEMHHRLAQWLCETYSAIVLPKFSPKQVGRRKDLPVGQRRRIGRKTTRRMMQLGHYKFRQFLLHKAKEYGASVVLCHEGYTTKTCGQWGILNENVGASEVFECAACGYKTTRDGNAGRNIMLRCLAVELNIVDQIEDGAGCPAGS